MAILVTVFVAGIVRSPVSGTPAVAKHVLLDVGAAGQFGRGVLVVDVLATAVLAADLATLFASAARVRAVVMAIVVTASAMLALAAPRLAGLFRAAGVLPARRSGPAVATARVRLGLRRGDERHGMAQGTVDSDTR